MYAKDTLTIVFTPSVSDRCFAKFQDTGQKKTIRKSARLFFREFDHVVRHLKILLAACSLLQGYVERSSSIFTNRSEQVDYWRFKEKRFVTRSKANGEMCVGTALIVVVMGCGL